MRKKSNLLMLILIAAITASGCNSVQTVDSTTTNTVPITNTSSLDSSEETILTAQQILGDISIQSVILKEDGVIRKKAYLTTSEQLEKVKELWNQIKVKESSDVTVQELDILYGEPSRIIQINDNLELYVDATLKRIYIDSKGYELIEFPRELFNEIMETAGVNEITPDENYIREYYERFQKIGADNLAEEMMQKYGDILRGIE
ncbi:MAG TPA: hypothetical protein IAC96_01955 [Candidatus Fimimorpha faecalis]|uniref:Bypass of forespore C C-terminal domain-containing protein n=1 Tax=Candidatus Fimimorpha faecalis TaxID=2840824 RepID=A0A9D1JC69_9FIRM|nr:hypothetical protein [Candidatus Fimimorpha faecalis]